MLRVQLLLGGAVVLAVGAAAPAAGHSVYDTDPNANACCGGEHCGPVPLESVTWDPEAGGWTLLWRDEEVFVPRESALLSPDEGFHACGSRTRGLFGAEGPLPPGAAAELSPWKMCFLVPRDALETAFADVGDDRLAFGEMLDGLIGTARDLSRRGFEVGGRLAALSYGGAHDPGIRTVGIVDGGSSSGRTGGEAGGRTDGEAPRTPSGGEGGHSEGAPPSVVPAPPAVLMLLSGLAALGLARRRRGG
ncbi:MAG: hypothetical protein CML46_03075 [Rhodobacteraceae bacterium]|nr:hypothetical protein [Paracoccaceae bacterium]MBR25923.1 hypothetical protein [Paracoccaceae bacterium]